MDEALNEFCVTREQLEQLAAFDTPTIVNALESLGIYPRAVLGPQFHALMPIPNPMVGLAVTGVFKQQWGDKWAHLEPWLGFLEKIERTPLPVVAVLDDASPEPGQDVMIGEGMARAMRAVGAVGAICDGPNRDIVGLREMQFPVIGRGLAADRGLIRFWGFNVAVTLGQTRIEPYSLMHADENGAVVIPTSRVAEVLNAAARVVQKERDMFRQISAPGFSVAQLRAIYDRLLVRGQVRKQHEPTE